MFGLANTLTESVARRIEELRFERNINSFYYNRLCSDIEKLKGIVSEQNYHSMLGSVYSVSGNREKSIAEHQLAVKLKPSALNHYNLGFTYEIFGNLELAKECYVAALAEANDSPTVLNALNTRFISLFDIDRVQQVSNYLRKLNINSNDNVFLQEIFPIFGSKALMADFGIRLNTFIHKFINARFLAGTTIKNIDDQIHFWFMVHCENENDAIQVAQCNLSLSEFMLDFAEQSNLNFDNFFVSCGVIE